MIQYDFWLGVGSWMFCLQNLPCLVSFWCMLGGRVEVCAKNNLYRFIEDQIHFGISRMNLFNQNRLLFIQIQTFPPKQAPSQVELILYAKHQMENIQRRTPNGKSHRLKG